MTDIDGILTQLITAFHILHHKGVLDAYGHVSVRNPLDSTTFFSSAQPANLISSPSHLLQWNISDGSPVQNPVGGTRSVSKISPYSEHYIHSSLLSRYPSLNSIVHAHSPDLIACGHQRQDQCDNLRSSSVTFPVTSQLAGFIRSPSVRVFDPTHHYENCTISGHKRNLLISTRCLGDSLAESIYHKTAEDGSMTPLDSLVLQRGHGFCTWASSLEDAVYRAVYAQLNAQILIRARTLGGASLLEDGGGLTADEARACAEEINCGMPKAWPSWAMEARRSGMYLNELE